ncbi:MAG: hypothetical protein WDW36_003829 [Sanguina aurantia]
MAVNLSPALPWATPVAADEANLENGVSEDGVLSLLDLGLSMSARIEWWGATLQADSSSPPADPTPPTYTLMYDPSEGFPAESRTIKFTSAHTLRDSVQQDPMYWRAAGDGFEPPSEDDEAGSGEDGEEGADGVEGEGEAAAGSGGDGTSPQESFTIGELVTAMDEANRNDGTTQEEEAARLMQAIPAEHHSLARTALLEFSSGLSEFIRQRNESHVAAGNNEWVVGAEDIHEFKTLLMAKRRRVQ